eukprot:4304531-Prymnesium_polylepis.1
MNAFSTALASGAMAHVTILRLDSNQIGDKGTDSFSTALASGAMAQLNGLDLGGNQIGDEGMNSFSVALASGALPALQTEVVDQEHEDHQELVAACEPRNIKIA